MVVCVSCKVLVWCLGFGGGYKVFFALWIFPFVEYQLLFGSLVYCDNIAFTFKCPKSFFVGILFLSCVCVILFRICSLLHCVGISAILMNGVFCFAYCC